MNIQGKKKNKNRPVNGSSNIDSWQNLQHVYFFPGQCYCWLLCPSFTPNANLNAQNADYAAETPNRKQGMFCFWKLKQKKSLKKQADPSKIFVKPS
jgi:hypothetical protein